MLLFHAHGDQGASTPEREALAQRVNEACEEIRALSIPLIEALEARHPGHPFGWKKFQHMERLMGEVEPLANGLGLTERELLLLRLVARAHDIGRHQEALDQLDTLRPGPRHGHLSAELLRAHGVLDHFEPADREIILGAVIQHAEREVNLPHGLARTLCYVLRDSEKLDIFRDPKYRSREGILEQIRLHYLDDDKRDVLASVEVRAFALAHLFENPMSLPPENSKTPDARAVLARIGEVMTKGVQPTLVDQFCEMRALAVQDIRHSYASYELFQLAFVFDIQSSGVLRAIEREGHFEGKLRFLEERLSPVEMARVRGTLERYLEGRRLED